MVETLEEIICSTCKFGKIRPLQFSFDQAIVNCDNSECDSYLEKWPWECIVSNTLKKCPTSFEKESLTSSDSSGIQSDFSSSTFCDVPSADKEVELIFRTSSKNVNSSKSLYEECKSYNRCLKSVEFDISENNSNTCKVENVDEEFLGLLTSNVYSRSHLTECDSEKYDKTTDDRRLFAYNSEVNLSERDTPIHHSAFTLATPTKMCNDLNLNETDSIVSKNYMDSFQTEFGDEFIKQSSEFDFSSFSLPSLKNEEVMTLSKKNDTCPFDNYQMIPLCSTNSFNLSSNVADREYSTLLSPKKENKNIGNCSSPSQSQNLSIPEGMSNCDYMSKSSDVDSKNFMFENGEPRITPPVNNCHTKDYSICDSKLNKSEITNCNEFYSSEGNKNSPDVTNTFIDNLYTERSLENRWLYGETSSSKFIDMNTLQFQNSQTTYNPFSNQFDSISSTTNSTPYCCENYYEKSHLKEEIDDRVHTATPKEFADIQLKHERDIEDGNLFNGTNTNENCRNNNSVNRFCSTDDIPIITIDENDNLDIIIPIKKEMTEVKRNCSDSELCRSYSNCSSESGSSLFDSSVDSHCNNSSNVETFYTIYLPHNKFGNIKAEPEYFDQSFQIQNFHWDASMGFNSDFSVGRHRRISTIHNNPQIFFIDKKKIKKKSGSGNRNPPARKIKTNYFNIASKQGFHVPA